MTARKRRVVHSHSDGLVTVQLPRPNGEWWNVRLERASSAEGRRLIAEAIASGSLLGQGR